MFIVFNTVTIVYIFVFMTCSTFRCVCETLKDPWNLCICGGGQVLNSLLRIAMVQHKLFCRVAVYGCSATQYGFE